MLEKVKMAILRNKRWVILAVVLFIFTMLAESVKEQEKLIFDSIIYRFLVEHRTNFLTIFFKIMTQCGSALFLITITILCIVFIKNRKYKLTIPINLIVITIANILLKNIFNRPRPNEFRLIEETGFSFPSGHSMVNMAFYGYFIYLVYKHIKNKEMKYILCTALTALIFLIALSRIYLGVHYASDVVAGLCFSIAYLIFMISTDLYK